MCKRDRTPISHRVPLALLRVVWLGVALLAAGVSDGLAAEVPRQEARFYHLADGTAEETATRLVDVLGALPERSLVSIEPDGQRLRVQGTARAHALTEQFLKLLSRGPPNTAGSSPVLKAYRPAGRLADVAAQLRQRYAHRPDVRLVTDPRSGQLLVLAPAAVHHEMAQDRLVAVDDSGAPTSSDSAAETMPARAPPARDNTGPLRSVVSETPADDPRRREPVRGSNPVRRDRSALPVEHLVLALRHIDFDSLHSRFEQLLGRPLPTTTDRSLTPMRRRFSLDDPSSELIVVESLAGTPRVVLHGPSALVRSWAQVIGAIDVPAGLPSRATQLVAVRTSQPGKVNQVLAALRHQAGAARRAGRGAPEGFQGRREQTTQTGRLIAMLFQSGGESSPSGAPSETGGPRPEGAAAERAAGAEKEEMPPGGTIGPVDIQFLEGSDVIVIRGHERDVARVRQLIKQIELLSAETEPKIVVRRLRHVNSVALATLLDQVYEQVYLTRQGSISITPLIEPNAVLLVGREENVGTIEELIGRLDRPVDAATQFRVFRLRHASAVEAKGTIDQFLQQRSAEDPAGLAPRARVTADFRSNALIVQAAPRDMTEVEALIKRLDTGTSEAVNELRIFQLNNSQADELAEILRQAVYVQQQQGTPGAGVPPSQGPNAAARSAAAAVPAGASAAGRAPRSTALKFVTVDQQGQRRFRTGILTDVRITADARANTVIVSAPADSMELIGALVRELDRAPAIEAQIKVFTIVRSDATTLVDILERLFGQPAAGQPAGAANRLEAGRSLAPLQFSVDARTNSVIASGSSHDLEVVEAILLRLDESDSSLRQTTVYRLKNSPAQAVADAVNEFLSTKREVQELAPSVLSPFEQLEREVVVVPEVVSNSLIVSATPRYYEEIRTLVEQLDERPPMVMIQVLIAEIRLRDTDEFGVEMGLQDSLLFDRSVVEDLLTIDSSFATQEQGSVNTIQQQTIISAPLAPGFNFNNGNPLGNNGGDRALRRAAKTAGQALSNFAVGRTNSELGFGGLVLSASSSAVSILIRALQESRRLEILSRPQIMTLDNQPAYIQVGQQVPRIIGTAVDLGVQQNQIRDENVGIILRVRPRISPDGMVVMEIDATKSEVGPEAEGIPVSISASGDVIRSPRIDRTFAQTTVAAVSGQTVVLGGLITKNKSDIHRRVPFLSNIPVLGHLFRYDLTTEQRTELLIILTPHVVRSQADAELIKQVESARMSWCLSDVIEMNGPAGLRGRGDAWADDETTTIYPDVEPLDAEELPPPADEPPADLPHAAPPRPWDESEPSVLKMGMLPGGREPRPVLISTSDASPERPAGVVRKAAFQATRQDAPGRPTPRPRPVALPPVD